MIKVLRFKSAFFKLRAPTHPHNLNSAALRSNPDLSSFGAGQGALHCIACRLEATTHGVTEKTLLKLARAASRTDSAEHPESSECSRVGRYRIRDEQSERHVDAVDLRWMSISREGTFGLARFGTGLTLSCAEQHAVARMCDM